VIRIEGFHEWIGGPAVPAPRRTSLIIPARRSLLVALLVPLRRTFGRLGEYGRRVERKNHSDKNSHLQHLSLSVSVICARKRNRGLDSILRRVRCR
jgi:hypothetical protein